MFFLTPRGKSHGLAVLDEPLVQVGPDQSAKLTLRLTAAQDGNFNYGSTEFSEFPRPPSLAVKFPEQKEICGIGFEADFRNEKLPYKAQILDCVLKVKESPKLLSAKYPDSFEVPWWTELSVELAETKRSLHLFHPQTSSTKSSASNPNPSPERRLELPYSPPLLASAGSFADPRPSHRQIKTTTALT